MEEHCQGSILNEALSISDLVSNGATFEINSDFNVKDDEDIFPELETGDDDVHYEPVLSPWERDFNELRGFMVKLPDYNIYKLVKKEGYGVRKMPEKARVTIHYNAYWEKEMLFFDSTYMRGQPKMFVTGKDEVLSGLEIAVKSMREGEESQFLISYELLFGEMGCPPRIKPKATGLFIIHLISMNETGDEDAIESVNSEDRKKFVVIIPKVREVQIRGSDLFRQGHIANACKMYHKALTTLECCRLSNDAEQKEQQQLIVQLYTNLAICYNKLNLPKKACLMCNEIGRITDIKMNCKALFQEGRALMKLGDYKRARQSLLQALRLEPKNESITAEMKLLEHTNEQYVSNEKEIWKRAFGNTTSVDSTAVEVSDAFKASMASYLDDFVKNDKVRVVQLPESLSNEEIKSLEMLIKDMKVKLEIKNLQNSTCYELIKGL